ncbi:zinc finger CW-type PWWP domain protein 2 [Emys orbicularis]|uniref:zinc finger CW-type PWWP domain protein 2 n=1 Tax=Emys orbicularis TaxID=82168 RepID=UPI0031FC1B72
MLQEVMQQSLKENQKAQEWRESESRIRQENAAHRRRSTEHQQQSTDRLISILERQADSIQALVAMQVKISVKISFMVFWVNIGINIWAQEDRKEQQIEKKDWKNLGGFAMDTINENHFYLDKVWVQCEIGSCLKWRLLSSDDAAQVDQSEPWYCYMNTDPWFNNCSVSEEYFPEESEFNKSGFKYVYSELPIGSLVLVKMRNWPRWPGILCPDPLNGQYVTYDLDGYVKSNHVEFLGDPHSRGWVAVKYISRYPSSIKPEQCKRKKKWYTSALEEANKLLIFSALQRLEMCQLSENDALVLKGDVGSQVHLGKSPHLEDGVGDVRPDRPLVTAERPAEVVCKLVACSWKIGRLQVNGVGYSKLPQESLLTEREGAGSALLVYVEHSGDVVGQHCHAVTLQYCMEDLAGYSYHSEFLYVNVEQDLGLRPHALSLKSMLRCSLETMVSDDFLSKENLVVSETEVILKDLEQILRRVADPLKTACGLYGNGEGKDTGEKVTKCSTESTEGSPMENYTQEDCIIIDGIAFRAGECIDNISNKFKEIDSLMAEFQDSL